LPKNIDDPRIDTSKKKGNLSTWEKKIKKIAVTNQPASDEDCWLFKPDGTTGYAVFKIGNATGYKKSELMSKTSPDDSKRAKVSKPVNYRLHRVLYLLVHPEDYDLIVGTKGHGLDNEAGDSLIRHKCNNGRSDGVSSVCCNPFCLVKGTQIQNRDDNGCAYGSKWTCPHDPKCRFNHRATGLAIPCFNLSSPPPQCPHHPRCAHVLRI